MFESGQGVPKNHDIAMTLYKKSSLQGNALAQFSLGLLYEEAIGEGPDRPRAAACYRIAIANGNTTAQNYHRALIERLNEDEMALYETYQTIQDVIGPMRKSNFVADHAILGPLMRKRAKVPHYLS